MLRTATARVLDDRDLAPVLALLAGDPVESCLVAHRVEASGLEPRRLGAEVWGYGDAELDGVCLSGAMMVPLSRNDRALAAFADRARRQGRRCFSIVGPRHAVDPLWSTLEREWGPARDVRTHQPLMATTTTAVPADPAVRLAVGTDFDALLPACIAMYTEEMGVSPVGADGGGSYRSRVRDLIRGGRSFVRIEDGTVVFKAELGAVSRAACQIQGVWVHPERRGEGLAAGGTAAVVRYALDRGTPVVSLYVNDFNVIARRVYERVGFQTVGMYMCVLF